MKADGTVGYKEESGSDLRPWTLAVPLMLSLSWYTGIYLAYFNHSQQ